MNESTLVPREEMSDLDWLARNVHVWPKGDSVDGLVLGCTFFDTGVCRSVHVYATDGSDYTTIKESEWLARRAELQNKPSWEYAPEWAEWMAQDGDGEWYWYGVKPVEKGGFFHSEECDYAGRGEVLGDWRCTSECRLWRDDADYGSDASEIHAHSNQPRPSTSIPECEEVKQFEPFVSVEDAATAKQPSITPSKYTKTIHGVSVDVYDVLQAWGVSNPALQHLIKKALQCGQRGHKDNAQDLQDIIDSAIRAKELES